MTARPIGTIALDGTVTCDLCPWTTTDRVDPVGALTQHRAADHPEDRRPAAAPAPSRHPAGAVLGAILLALFGALAATAWTAGGWWIAAAIPAALLASLGAYGLVSDLQRTPRDGKGRRLR